MFEGAFSFRGRVGRVQYLTGQLTMIPVAVVVVIVAIVMIATTPRSPASLVFFGVLGVMMAVAFFWYSLSLQVRRVRDIGWSPAIVLGGWFFLLVADAIVARHVPAMAISRSGTLFGTLLNLALTAALYLWPGDGGTDDAARAEIAACFDAPDREYVPLAAQPFAISGPAAAPMAPRVSSVRRKTFGKRGLT